MPFSNPSLACKLEIRSNEGPYLQDAGSKSTFGERFLTFKFDISSDEVKTACRDQHAVIIGAGPAGSLAAMALARQGFRVDVFEKRPEPKLDHVSAYICQLDLLNIANHPCATVHLYSEPIQKGSGRI